MPSKRKDTDLALTDASAAVAVNEALYDHDAERMVCGYSMDTPGVLTGDMVSRLSADDFHLAEARATFAAIKSVLASDRLPVPLTVLQEMRPDLDPSCVPSIFDLEEWKNKAIWSPEAEGHAARILKFSEARRLEALLGSAVRLLHTPEAINAPLGSLTMDIQGKFLEVRANTGNVDEYDAESLEQVDRSASGWLVDGVLQDNGINLLMGDGGIGKSLAAMDLTVRVLAGGSAFGGLVSRLGGVVYLSADVSKRDMAERMHRLRIGAGCLDSGSLPGLMGIRAPLDFADPASFALVLHKASEAAQRHPEGRCALVVVDSLASYIFNLDENSATDMAHVMTQLRLLSERTGAAILTLHHTNKNELSSGSNRGRGSTALPNSADVVLHMVKKGPVTILGHTKCRNGPPMQHLTFAIEDDEDGGMLTRFVPASANDIGEVLADICLNELARLAKESEGEPLGRQELFLALNAVGHFSFKTKERGWSTLKMLPGFTFGKNGKTVSVIYRTPGNQQGA